MLSKQHQELMMVMFLDFLKDGIQLKDARPIYKSYVSFYRATKYLMESGLLRKKRDIRNHSIYTLTLKGEILARVLCTLIDNPPEVRDRADKIRVN